uniref:DUF4283 domain-containing protein n=1 Tax=Quercus lobata TaxID=97700 RepID=A0A7N2LPM7_QUELO
MPDLSCDLGEEDVTEDTGTPMHGNADEDCSRNDELHHSDDDELNAEAWEIRVTLELKRKLAGPWQTSIILKLMGRPLGYRALQTRLAGIWRPSGMMHLIDIGYGFFIMRFDEVKDYHHALMDGPWFVGD